MHQSTFSGRMISGVAAAAATLVLSLPAQAADEPKYNNFEITPFVLYLTRLP